MGKEIRMYTARWEEDNWEKFGGPSLPIQFWDYGSSEIDIIDDDDDDYDDKCVVESQHSD